MKQGGAASSMPAADLDASLHAMQLGDPSSSRPQQQHRASPTPLLLLPRPPHVLVPTSTPVAPPPPRHLPQPPPQVFVTQPLPHPLQPPPRALVPTSTPFTHPLLSPSRALVSTATHDRRMRQQQLQLAPPYWSQPQPQSYGGDESSTGARFVSPVGAHIYASLRAARSPSSVYASLYGAHSPRFNAPATPFPPVAPKPSKLTASAKEYHPSAAQSSSTPSFSASRCPPQPGAAAVSDVRYENASLAPYASALLSARRASQADYRSWSHAPAIGRVPTPDAGFVSPVGAARLHPTAMKPPPVTVAEKSVHAIRLLAEGGDEVRLHVLAAVKRDVHRVMRSREAHIVFLELLRACEWRFDELQGIVEAACNGKGLLMHVVQQDHGETVLKELIRVVAPYPLLCAALIGRLMREGLMEHHKGAEVLRHCFTAMAYDNCSIIIRFAILAFNDMLSSASGCRCMVECFKYARNGELRALEEIILSQTSLIAKGAYSNYVLQGVLDCGSEQLKELIVRRVAEDIVSLSLNQSGSFVVEACFLRTGSLPMLQRVLAAFLRLPGDQLAQLVKGGYSNYVVHKLLTAAKDALPESDVGAGAADREAAGGDPEGDTREAGDDCRCC
ncbi:hypothetical protein ACP70R_017076 [Stipagrostis hirtigluma subsp. patula]